MNPLWIVAIVVAVFVLAIIIIYNGLVRIKNQVENSWAQIDVQLKRRFDLIPNLIETVKGYAKHEKGVLEEITKARTAFMSATTVQQKGKAANMLEGTLKTLFAVSENYPKLQANENFLQLQEELSGTESKIAYARQHYNDMVMELNTKVQTFPSNVFARMFGFTAKEQYPVPEEERKNVKVQF
ncbi:LemA family protein [Candidatus Woesearchaeota archaeon]|nr:LemA family protein [Candidatus Woesearchaeota archaeon]